VLRVRLVSGAAPAEAEETGRAAARNLHRCGEPAALLRGQYRGDRPDSEPNGARDLAHLGAAGGGRAGSPRPWSRLEHQGPGGAGDPALGEVRAGYAAGT